MTETTQPRIRLLVEGALADDVRLTATAGQAHYLRTVMRLGTGAMVAVFNGRDGEWHAVLEEGRGRALGLRVLAQGRPQADESDLWLLFAPIKRARLELMIEKAVELGVSRLVPVRTQYTEPARMNEERMRLIIAEACEQCRRLTVPALSALVSLSNLLATWPEERLLVACVESGPAVPLVSAARDARGRPAALLIGPEGGFSDTELDRLGDFPFGVKVGLGPRILRAETAALAALACWQAFTDDREG